MSSGFLQVLIRSIARVNLKRTKLLIRWLLDNCFAPESKNAESDEKQEEPSTLFETDSCVRYEFKSTKSGVNYQYYCILFGDFAGYWKL